MKKNNSALYSSILLLTAFNNFTVIKAQNIYLVDAAHTSIVNTTPVTTVNTASWNNATGNLQAALTSAALNGGGQVWVKAATYKPTDYPNGCSNCGSDRDKAFLLRNNVALYGGFAGTETLLSQRSATSNLTILSGDIGTINDNSDNCYHTIITINTGAATILDGFTITGGNANGTGSISVMGQNSMRNTGGGMLNNSLSSPTINNCTFGNGSSISNSYKCLPGITNCSFNNAGIVNDSFSNCIITGCQFSNITGTAVLNNLSNPGITNCSFSNNNRGISNDLSNPIISDCSFTNNSGGSMINGDFTQPTITNCTFTNGNMTNGPYSAARITNCLFANNSIAINNTRASPSVTKCIFTNNTTGIYNLSTASPIVTNSVFANNTSYGIFNDYLCNPSIANCTFVNNSSYGIYYSSVAYSNSKITNCVIWGNGSGNTTPGIFYSPYGTNPPVVTYSIVQGGFSGTGNLNIDPLYKNAAMPAGADGIFGSADDGLQLLPCSPAINSGTNSAVPGIVTDFVGATRIQGGVVDRGAYEYQGNGLAADGGMATSIVSPGIITQFITDCQLIATLSSTGASPVSGNATARIWIDAVQCNYNGQMYLKRHYEIIPAANPATATARITLYATQQDFDDFNNSGSKANLPTSAADVTGIESLRIIKFGGPSNNSTGLPTSYTQPGVEINPADNNIVWNNSLERWEITFDITGFGGFLIGNENSSILPLTLLDFNGKKMLNANHAMLNWHTAHEVNTGYFELQRSTDNNHFTTITKVQAKGRVEAEYSYTDKGLQAGLYYYRLQMMDKDGKQTYSSIVSLQFNAQNAISLYPVPAKDIVWLNGGTASLIGSDALLIDIQGRIAQTIRIQQWPQPINITTLHAGNYLIKLPGETTVKLIKQ